MRCKECGGQWLQTTHSGFAHQADSTGRSKGCLEGWRRCIASVSVFPLALTPHRSPLLSHLPRSLPVQTYNKVVFVKQAITEDVANNMIALTLHLDSIDNKRIYYWLNVPGGEVAGGGGRECGEGGAEGAP